MIKKFAAVSIFTLVLSLTTCQSITAEAKQLNTHVTQIVKPIKQTNLMSDSYLKTIILTKNTELVNKMITKVSEYNQKTWYVFSGSTPSGWDCSGLVMWSYDQIGINLEHSATIQKHSGKTVKSPKVGDIVAFGWKDRSDFQHVGIYLGDGLMIHAGGGKGEKTETVNINKWGKHYTKITYTRLIDTL
jgi:cell wall-associated NlpC family hydrolase